MYREGRYILISTVTAASESFQKPKYLEYVYARSPAVIKALGQAAMNFGHEATKNEAYRVADELAFDDFASGLGENLNTAPGVADKLDVLRVKRFDIKDGHVVTADGTPMVEIVTRGYEVSTEAAINDPRMKRQAARDEGDVMTAKIVDNLQPGSLYATVSMEPKEGLVEDPTFWHDLGYCEGLAYVQWYYRVDEKELVTGSYSVDNSDKDIWRSVQLRHEIAIPDDTSCDEWIRFGLQKKMTLAEAVTFAGNLRNEYYAASGEMNRRYSVTDFVKNHEQIVRSYFNSYMIPLAEAAASGRNNETMQGLAHTILGNTGIFEMKPEVRASLLRVANGGDFDIESIGVMENLIRYALAVQLRDILLTSVNSGDNAAAQYRGYTSDVRTLPAYMESKHATVAAFINRGVQEALVFYGCAGLQLLSRASSNQSEIKQDVYGGKADDVGEIHYSVCRTAGCPSHPSITEVGGCGVCLSHCQRLWDQGINPETVYVVAESNELPRKGRSDFILLSMLSPTGSENGKNHSKPVKAEKRFDRRALTAVA